MLGTGNVNLSDIAASVPYDDTLVSPALSATDVQGAIDALKVAQANGIANFNITATATFNTTSATDVAITSFNFTPTSGTWLVLFSASCTNTGGGVGNNFTIYKDAAALADSTRPFTSAAGGAHAFTANTQTIVQVTGSNVISVKCNTSGTLAVNGRSLVLIRLGP